MSFILSLLTCCALCLNVETLAADVPPWGVPDGHWVVLLLAKLEQCLDGPRIVFLVLFLSLLFLYYRFLSMRPPFLPSAAIVATLFSLFLVGGQSYEQVDSWDLVFGAPCLFCLACLVLVGYFAFFYALITALFCWLDRPRPPKSLAKPLADRNRRNLFLLCFLIFLLCWSPYLLVCYPGSVTYDGLYQLGQFSGATVPTNHHPWLSTVLMGFFFQLGSGISAEAGIFLYVLFQSAVCAAAFAGVCCQIRAMASGRITTPVAILYFALLPTWGAYAQMFVKDTIFYGVFAAFFLFTVQFVLDRGQCRPSVWAGLLLSGLLCTVLRNNGLYTVVPTLLLLAVAARAKKSRVMVLSMGMTVVLIYSCLTQVLLPAWGVAPGSVREMLSLPFQQTARYVVEYGEELTAEEIAVIDRVLDYETIAAQYDPRVADPVKNTYRGTGEDLGPYFGLWLRCGLRHPGVYVEATLNSMFGYVLPGYRYGSYGGHYFLMQEPDYGIEVAFAHPEAVQVVDYGSRLWSVTPGLLLLNAPGTYSWLLILCTVALLRKRKWVDLIVTLPLWITLGICCISPVNGLLRYMLPIMAATPSLLAFTWNTLAQRAQKRGYSDHG